MSIYKAYTALKATATINDKRYKLVEYAVYYYPYSHLLKKAGEYNNQFTIKESADMEIKLRSGRDKWGSRGWFDQFGNEWHHLDMGWGSLYMAYADDVPLTESPTSYYDACQLISKDANLIDKSMVSGYAYCYNRLNEKYKSFDPTDKEWVKDFSDMIPCPYKVGDRVFYVSHKDRDTRCGERNQIETFIISNIYFVGDDWMLSNCSENASFSFSNHSVEARKASKDIETLCKRYKDTLYMWHHLGGVSIEPCNSTEYFMKYIDKQE